MYEQLDYACVIGRVPVLLSACILPLIPAYLSYMAGSAVSGISNRNSKVNQLVYSIGFIIGFSVMSYTRFDGEFGVV